MNGGAYVGASRAAVRATLGYLRTAIALRDAGGRVAYTTNPAWLVTMAVNRKAGWPDDPSLTRGSARPVEGRYPRQASGSEWDDLRRLAARVNTPRLVVRARECPARYRNRLRRRLLWPEKE